MIQMLYDLISTILLFVGRTYSTRIWQDTVFGDTTLYPKPLVYVVMQDVYHEQEDLKRNHLYMKGRIPKPTEVKTTCILKALRSTVCIDIYSYIHVTNTTDLPKAALITWASTLEYRAKLFAPSESPKPF